MKKINLPMFCLLFLMLFSVFTKAQKVGNNAGYKPLSNGWPELKRGNNRLTPRYVFPKPSKINIDKKSSVAGLFIVKFTEGTHIRFRNDDIFFDEKNAVNNAEEMARLARAGIKVDGLISQLGSVKGI